MLRRKVERFLKTRRVPPGASLLLGYSGGPDSTCLVSLLHSLSEQYHYRLACAYYDHGIRPREERETELGHVRAFSGSLGIELFTGAAGEGTLEAEAAAEGTGLEAAARRARRRFFRELRERNGFDYLLLAHTLDDQLETVIWRVFQGSGPGGIRGIRPAHGWVLRPLLGAARPEIVRYLQERGLAAVADSTNEKDRFLRNRIRHALVPVIREIFPGMGRSLAALSGKMAVMDDFLRQQAAAAFLWKKTGPGVKTDALVFFRSPPALRLYALYREAGRLRRGDGPGPTGAIPYRFFAPLLGRAASLDRRLLIRGHGLVIRRERRGLFLERCIVADTKKGYFITIHPGAAFELLGRRYIFLLPGEAKKPADVVRYAFEAQKVALPLVMRSRRSGDRIDLGFGNKRLKKLFNEWRAANAEKDVIPVLEDGNGVLAVLGSVCGFKDILRRDVLFQDRPGRRAEEALRFCETAEREVE